MTTTFASRSILLAVGLGFTLAAACFDESVLVNEDCLTDDDCARSQHCNRTPYQETLPDPYGWCRSDGDECAEGSQPGCYCEPNGVNFCCRGTAAGTLAPFVGNDGVCICAFAEDTNYFPTQPAEGAGGCIVAN